MAYGHPPIYKNKSESNVLSAVEEQSKLTHKQPGVRFYPMSVTPTRADLSNLTSDEQAIIQHRRELEMMGGVEVSVDVAARNIQSILYFTGALARMTVSMAKNHPEESAKLAVIAEYIATMLWEWHLRCNDPEILKMMEELGRSAAKIGKGLFPLDDATHPINRKALRNEDTQ